MCHGVYLCVDVYGCVCVYVCVCMHVFAVGVFELLTSRYMYVLDF